MSVIDNFTKKYTDRKYKHTQTVSHKGTMLAFAMDDNRRIFYSVLNFGKSDKGFRDANYWLDNPIELVFPNEIAQAGFGIIDPAIMPTVKKGSGQEVDPNKIRPEEIDPFLSSTARFTADAPFQVLSDGKFIYVFRQSIGKNHQDMIFKLGDSGNLVKDALEEEVPIVDEALLCDRFVLSGVTLMPKMEIRYRRSKSKNRPDSNKDSLGAKDMNNKYFFEPTIELDFVKNLRDGRFTVTLLPTQLADIKRWQIFTHNSKTRMIDSFNIERSADGLFNTKGTLLYTSPDPQYQKSVLEREPGQCPFTQRDLIPIINKSGYSEWALELDGTDDYIEIPYSAKLNKSVFTVSCWVKPKDGSGYKAIITSRDDSPIRGYIFYIHDGKLEFWVGNGSSWQIINGPALTMAAWTHFTGTYDGDSIRLYVNGKLEGTLKTTLSLNTARPLRIGAGSTETTPSFFYKGVVEEIRIWDRPLEEDEIKEDMNFRLIGNEPGLVAYWILDEGSGVILHDQTDNVLNGDIKGGTAWVKSDAPIGEHPGTVKNSFIFQGRTIQAGLTSLLYYQQENASVGYNKDPKPIKRNARLMLAAPTGGPDPKGQITSNKYVAVLDFAVSREGKIAQVPDSIDLKQALSAGSNEDLDRLNRLEQELQALKEQQELKVVPNYREQGGLFGQRISTSGDWVIVGAHGEDVGEVNAGAVYVFKIENGQLVQKQKIQPADRKSSDFFGASVSINGDWMAVGASEGTRLPKFSGAVYTYRLENNVWVQKQRIESPEKVDNAAFGASLAISGEWMIVGAFGLSNTAGAAFLFHLENGTWVFKQKVEASDKPPISFFGFSVDIKGLYAVVGAIQPMDFGACYVFQFENGSWVQKQKLTSQDSNALQFGHSVSISTEWIMVGSTSSIVGNLQAVGAAYAFHLEGGQWVKKQKIEQNINQSGAHFGYSVDLTDTVAIVSATDEIVNGIQQTGAVYVYNLEGSQWVQKDKLVCPDKSTKDWFGSSCVINGGMFIIGASGKEGESGAMYLFGGSAGAGVMTAMKAELAALKTKVGIDVALPMYLVHTDPFGLTVTGGLLGFAYTNQTPYLFDSAMGRVALYFCGANNQFFATYYDTKTARAQIELPAEKGVMTCVARFAEAEMDNLTVSVENGSANDTCKVIISNAVTGISETWLEVPRDVDRFADVFNGAAGSSYDYAKNATTNKIAFNLLKGSIHVMIITGTASGNAQNVNASFKDKTISCQWVAEAPGKTLAFDGINDYITLADKTKLAQFDAEGDVTIESWVQPSTILDHKEFVNVNAILFDGVDDYVTLPTAAIPTGNEITVAFWAFGGNMLPRTNNVIDGSSANGKKTINIHFPWSDGVVYFDCGNDSAGNDRIEKACNASDYKLKWTHWAFTKNVATGDMKIYMNGALWHSGGGKTKTIPQTTSVTLGKGANGFWHGSLTELSIWSRALSLDEVKELMNQTLLGDENGLKAYYKFEGSQAKDVTINAYNAAITGAVILPASSAIEFDGNTYMDLPAASIPTGNEITCMFWANGGSSLPKDNSVIGCQSGGAEADRPLNIHFPFTNSNIYFDCGNQSSGYDRIEKAASASDFKGKWNHWAFIKNATTGDMKIYMNGQLWHSGTGKTRPLAQTTLARLGSRSNGDGRWHGTLSSVSLWKRALTQNEVQMYMIKQLSGSEDGLWVTWNFDSGVAKDITGHNYNAVIPASGIKVMPLSLKLQVKKPVAVVKTPYNRLIVHHSDKSKYTLGMIKEETTLNSALVFDGVDDYVQLPKMNIDYSQGLTIEAWMYFDSLRTWPRLIDFGTGAATQNILVGFLNDKVVYHVYKDGTSQGIEKTSAIETGKWFHLAVTHDKTGRAVIYKNGVEVISGTVHLPNNVERSYSFIGRSNWAGDALFHGKMDEVRLWNRVRTPEEINYFMNKRLEGAETGLACYWHFEGGLTRDYSQSGINGTFVGGTPQATASALKLTSNNWFAGVGDLFKKAQLPASLVEESQSITKSAMIFDGVDDYVSLPEMPGDIFQTFTIEAWVYFETFKNAMRIFDIGNGMPSDNIILSLNGTTGSLIFTVCRAATYKQMQKDNILELKKWTHLAVVMDVSGRAIIYKDGLEILNAVLNVPTDIKRIKCYFGKSIWCDYGVNDPYFHGKMDDIRLWRVARTPEQIADDMNSRLIGDEEGLTAYWHFEGGMGKDYTGHGYDGTVSGHNVPTVDETPLKNLRPYRFDKWVHLSAVYNQAYALQFDGQAYLTVDHSPTLDIDRDLTIEAFIKVDSLRHMGIISKGRHGADVPYSLFVTNDGKVAFWFEDKNSEKYFLVTPYPVVQVGKVQKIAVTRRQTVTVVKQAMPEFDVTGVATDKGSVGSKREDIDDSMRADYLEGQKAGKSKPSNKQMDMPAGGSVQYKLEIVIYVDGQSVLSVQYNKNVNIVNNSQHLTIGKLADNTSFFKGAICELRLWNEVRDMSVIGVKIQGHEKGLISWWRFEENDGNIAYDSKSENHAKIIGAEWIKDPSPESSNLTLYQNGELITSAEDMTEIGTWGQKQFSLGATMNSDAALFPSDLQGLVLHLNGDSVSGTKWNDLSGLDNHATQSGSYTVPTVFNVSNYNGKSFKAARFDSNGGMTLPDKLNLQKPFTVITIDRYYGATKGRTLQSRDNNWLAGKHGGNNGCYMEGWVGTHFTAADNVFTLSTLTLEGVNPKWYINGELRASSGGTASPGRLGIGNGGAHKEPSTADIAAVLIWNRVLSDAERKRVEKWLGDMYGIAVPHKLNLAETIDHFAGKMEEVRIWKSARTEEQIQDNLFSRLKGEKESLIANYTFDRESETQIFDQSLMGNHLTLGKQQSQPTYVLSTAPISEDTAIIRSALAGVKTQFHDKIHSNPAVQEYADMQYDIDGNLMGVMKRCYSFVRDGKWHLVSGFKVGSLVTEWISQVQADPQIIGFIEGAPPVPSENFTASAMTVEELEDYDGSSSIEIVEADNVNYIYSSSDESGFDMAFEMKAVLGFKSASNVGFGLTTTLEESNLTAGIKGNLETSSSTTSEASSSFGRNMTKTTKLEVNGAWEKQGNELNKTIGRRYIPFNIGLALVQSDTMDVFALRLAHNNALVSYRMMPNPDIPKDWNIILFPINPTYTKQGTLDGKVGLKEDGSVQCDPHYPQSTTYGQWSYFKPIEAYAIKRRIEKETQELEAYYESSSTYLGAETGGNIAIHNIASAFTGKTSNAKEKMLGVPRSLATRNIANTYVWTSDGGFFSESTEVMEASSESTSGSFSLSGKAGLTLELNTAISKVAVGLAFDALFGGHMNMTKTKSKETEKSFSINVEVTGESDIQLYVATDAEKARYKGFYNEKGGVYDAAGNPVDRPGKVDAYRFMTFYLEPSKENFEDFFGKVVDPIWLEQSRDPNALALKQANQSDKKPRCWRVFHRVTFVSRVLPEIDAPGTPPMEKSMRNLDIASNWELIKRLEPFVRNKTGSFVDFSDAVRKTLKTYLPELQPYKTEIIKYAAEYFGVLEEI